MAACIRNRVITCSGPRRGTRRSIHVEVEICPARQVTTGCQLRLRVDELASVAGLTDPRCAEFVLAMHEVASNAVRNGGGVGTLRLYLSVGSLHCRITDDGPGFDEDIIPCSLPAPETSESGRGLWLVRQIVDRMKIVRPSVGADVTCTMLLPLE
ncbi:Anti-sigma regulatory factor (Ser/Thr protein kinase) [Streptomyces sp. 2231.1]|nr:Anti-sigma regulatory factor (Ser/Thr protein kinase) [Streptomyces sp. 2231.1]